MTSEKSERKISPIETAEIKISIGKRIVEAFNYQPDAEIAYLLKTKCSTVKSMTEGEQFPSAEILLLIRRTTGVSIDWILTGEGSKRPNEALDASSQIYFVREEVPLCGLA